MSWRSRWLNMPDQKLRVKQAQSLLKGWQSTLTVGLSGRTKPWNGWSLGDNIGLCLIYTPPNLPWNFICDWMLAGWLLAKPGHLATPLSNWTFQEGLFNSSWRWGPPFTSYDCLLLSWWEFAMLLSVRSLFLIPLDVCFQRCFPVSLT
jgi:hypothetical protein